MDRSVLYKNCSSEGCNSAVLNASEKYCLEHIATPPNSSSPRQSSATSSLGRSERSRSTLNAESQRSASNAGSNGQIYQGRSSSREMPEESRKTGQHTMKRTAMSSDLRQRIANSARKSMGGSFRSPQVQAHSISSEPKVDPPKPTTGDFTLKKEPTTESSLSHVDTNGTSRKPTGGFQTPRIEVSSSSTFNPSDTGENNGYSISLKVPPSSVYSQGTSRVKSTVELNRKGPAKSANSRPSAENDKPPPPDSIPEAPGVSRPLEVPISTRAPESSTQRDANHQASESREKASAVPPSAQPSKPGASTTPVFRTIFRPPASIKTAPPYASLSNKRKRDDSSSDSTTSSSHDDENDYADDEEEDDDVEEQAIRPQSASVHIMPIESASAKATRSQSPTRPVQPGSSLSFVPETGLLTAANAMTDMQRTFYPAHVGSNTRMNGINRLGTSPPCNGSLLPPSLGPPVTSSSVVLKDTEGYPPPRRSFERRPYTTQEDSQLENQFLKPISEVQKETRPLVRRRKVTCEQRRLELCATFDTARFDAMLYGQPGAATPPRGVPIPGLSIIQAAPLATQDEQKQFFARMDPRIHWAHNRSDEWYQSKMKEIQARGGRKANFGKAAARMRQRRLGEERRAAEAEAEVAAASKQGRKTVPLNSPEPWSHRRHMDFGDVPEKELPAYVQKNAAWMKAASWMRENRGKNLKRNEEAAALEANEQPWDHLFPRNGTRYPR